MILAFKKPSDNYLAILLIALGTIGLISGIVLMNHANGVSTPSNPTSVAPSTTQPTAEEIHDYTVPADQPRYISIPSLNIKARVVSLGVTKNNAVAAPANVFDAGWFNGSSKPGQAGAMVIDGHVSSDTTHGVFYDLKKLKSGDDITIQKGDGQSITYKVVMSKLYDAQDVDMSAVLKPAGNNKQGLNLITCDGKVIKGTHEFDKRLVIFAS